MGARTRQLPEPGTTPVHTPCTQYTPSRVFKLLFLPLAVIFPLGPNFVLRQIGTIASVILHGLLEYLPPHGQHKWPHFPLVSSEVTPKIGYENSRTNATTGSYTFNITICPTLSQRLPMHTVNCSSATVSVWYMYQYVQPCSTVPYVTIRTVPVLTQIFDRIFAHIL